MSRRRGPDDPASSDAWQEAIDTAGSGAEVRNALAAVEANLIYVVVASFVTGLAFGQVAGTAIKSLLKAAIVPVLFLMIYPMVINVDLKEIINLRRHAKPVGLSSVVSFAVAPLVAVGLTRTFFPGNPAYAVGLYFIALIPASGMTAAWTGLTDGDLEAALATAVNLLAAVAFLPAYLSVLVPVSVAFDPTALYRRLAQVVVLSMVVGNLTRRVLLRRYGSEGFKRLKPTFGGLSSAGVTTPTRVTNTKSSPVARGARPYRPHVKCDRPVATSVQTIAVSGVEYIEE